MSVQFLGPDVLFRGDQVAMDPDCCCSSSSSEGDCGPVLGDVPSEIVFSIEGVTAGTSCECYDGSGSGTTCNCDLHNVDVVGEDQGQRDDEYCSPPLPMWPGSPTNPYPFNGWPECCRIWSGSYSPGVEGDPESNKICDYSPDWPTVRDINGQWVPYPSHMCYLLSAEFTLETYHSFRFQNRWIQFWGRWLYFYATDASPEPNTYYPIGFRLVYEDHDEGPWTWAEIEERLSGLLLTGDQFVYFGYAGEGTPPEPEIPSWCNWEAATISVRAGQ